MHMPLGGANRGPGSMPVNAALPGSPGSMTGCGMRNVPMEQDSPRPSQRGPVASGEDVQRRDALDVQRLLLDVSRLAAARRDVDGLLGELVVVLRKAFEFDGLAVILHDPTRDEMVARFAGGSALPVKQLVTTPGTDAAGLAWLTQQPVFVPDVDRETRFPEIIALARSVFICSPEERSP